MDISRLACAVASEGLDDHAEALAAAAAAVRETVPGAAAALLDPSLPEVMRLRAFAVVARAAGREGRTETRELAGTVSG